LLDHHGIVNVRYVAVTLWCIKAKIEKRDPKIGIDEVQPLQVVVLFP
jgi:hypothetical protein